jgi:hypothetical protein
MGTHIVKTTIDIADDLLLKAKALAARDGTTLRTVIEQGIRLKLREQAITGPFVLKDGSVDGEGLQPEFEGRDWSDILAEAYKGRGG